MRIKAASLALAVSAFLIVSPSPASAGAIPSCVDVTTWTDWYDFAKVTNNCSTTKYVKVIWAFAADTACTKLTSGSGITAYRGRAARYDGTVTC